MNLDKDSNLAVLESSTVRVAEPMGSSDAVLDFPPVLSPVAPVLQRIGDFYELTKPRMNFLVVITTMVGFYLASPVGQINWLLLINTLIGTVATAASAAVLNQLMERKFDALMPRTRNRPIVTGKVLPIEALVFGITLGVLGSNYLAMFVNIPTAVLSVVTMASYLAVYTPLKRVSSVNTIVGAIPGAIPPVMGYTAVSGAITIPALALFAILFVWQTPHFLAIAIMYRDDYAKGGFKMLPVVDPDLRLTSRVILIYTLAMIPVSLLPVLIHTQGFIYAASAMLLGTFFLAAAINAARTRQRPEARKLFFTSIIYLPLLLAALMLDKR